MKILVKSRMEMQKILELEYLDPQKFNFISIRDHDAEPIFRPNSPFTVLNLQFSDINRSLKNCPEAILFSDDHAREIIIFLNEMDKNRTLVVNCHAGISRSGAVGDFARVKFKIPFKDFHKWNPHIQPNMHILKTLFKVQEEMVLMESFEDWI